MGLATTFVLAAPACWSRCCATPIPKEVRIATYIVIIATFVTVVDYAIQAISLDLYEALGAYIQLIVANCLVLGRAEAHAAKNPPFQRRSTRSAWAWVSRWACSMIGGVREILGAGKLFGISLFGDHFQPWVVMVLPPGGFFVLAGWLLLFATLQAQQQERKRSVAGGHST